ncbi:MAG: protein-disulfide reductase DsbD family protein [Bacteroidota bacterium]|nr:protein-disulfide reductase DsbD family protein [Bacteroidota bacterium]
MIKNIFFLLIFSVFANTVVKAQLGVQLGGPPSHAQWKTSTKKINDCEYDLIFTVTLEKGWHTFSIVKIKGAEKEVFTTEITFEKNKDYTLVGTLTETTPTTEYDATIKKNVLLHYNKAVFTQRIKLNNSTNAKITGEYEYQVCKGVCEKPPYETFTFDLKGTAACAGKK